MYGSGSGKHWSKHHHTASVWLVSPSLKMQHSKCLLLFHLFGSLNLRFSKWGLENPRGPWNIARGCTMSTFSCSGRIHSPPWLKILSFNILMFKMLTNNVWNLEIILIQRFQRVLVWKIWRWVGGTGLYSQALINKQNIIAHIYIMCLTFLNIFMEVNV